MDKINNILSIQNLSSLDNHSQERGLVDLLTCKLCKGYLIDATTLDLCMHSFCRPCAIKFIRDKPKCPECNLEIKDKRFLNRLKTDTTLQNIVYKLVPGLYEREMEKRRQFYNARPSPTPRYRSEMFGDIPPAKIIKPDQCYSVFMWVDTVATYYYVVDLPIPSSFFGGNEPYGSPSERLLCIESPLAPTYTTSAYPYGTA